MKLIWRVAPAPTGRYRVFQKRGWPSADWPNGQCAVMLSCEDAYSPARARGEVPHEEIRVYVADHSHLTTDGRPNFQWKLCKVRARSLEQAKRVAERVLELYPQFHPRDRS